MIAKSLIPILLVAVTSSSARADAPVQFEGSPRGGTTIGTTVGGAFIPGTDLGVLVVQANINVNSGWQDSRISPMVYRAWGVRDSVGVGTMGERRLNFRHGYTLAAGAFVAAHKIDGEGPTIAMAATGTPVAFRLGSRERWEVGLTVMLVYELAHSTTTPVAYVSLAYLPF